MTLVMKNKIATYKQHNAYEGWVGGNRRKARSTAVDVHRVQGGKENS
jgi:hypothetical protein